MTTQSPCGVAAPASTYLGAERACLERLLPGLDAELEELGFDQLESTDGLGIRVIKKHGGVRLCIPKAHGGIGATARESAQVQRAIASRSPSAAVATAMHHFTIATLVELSLRGSGLEWLLLEAIARDNLLVASGFAEGEPNGKILRPTMVLEKGADGFTITGVKRPCSLSKSMDLISVSVVVPGDASDEDDRLAVALIAARSEGISVGPFWGNRILAAAETGTVQFDRVPVDAQLLSYSGPPNSLDYIQTRGLIWFQLLISASYLGVASALVEKVVKSGRVPHSDLTQLGIELEGAMATLGGMAHVVESGESSSAALAQALFGRYSVQQAIDRATSLAFELAGGRDFARSGEASYLVAAARGLNFHPPSRATMTSRLGAYLDGHGLYEI
jgi:alkylation response protein AidB-like acyl-CoA dehydrogenase